MSQVRSLWAVIMLSVEESLTAFSGVSPDLVGHSQAVPKTVGTIRQRRSLGPILIPRLNSDADKSQSA